MSLKWLLQHLGAAAGCGGWERVRSGGPKVCPKQHPRQWPLAQNRHKVLSHGEAAPRAWRRARRSHVARAVSQQRRGVQRRPPAPLPPAIEPPSEHAQLGRAVAPGPQLHCSVVRVFQASLEAGLATVGARRRERWKRRLDRQEQRLVRAYRVWLFFRGRCDRESALSKAWRRADSAVYGHRFPLVVIKALNDLSGASRWKPTRRSTEEVNLKMKNTVK